MSEVERASQGEDKGTRGMRLKVMLVLRSSRIENT